jgi:hypothetical protein
MDKLIWEHVRKEKACIKRGMPPWKLKTFVKTRFASKIIMFEKTLELKQAIITCYGREKYHYTTKKFKGPNVCYYKNSHFYLEPYSLVIV